MSLRDAGLAALGDTEISRLEGSIRRRQKRRSRSQYTVSAAPIYDAVQGHAIAQLSGGGVAYTQRITNSILSDRTAISLPRGRALGFADAKPL